MAMNGGEPSRHPKATIAGAARWIDLVLEHYPDALSGYERWNRRAQPWTPWMHTPFFGLPGAGATGGSAACRKIRGSMSEDFGWR